MSSWETDSTEQFDNWFDDLSGSRQDSVVAIVALLEEKGPALVDRRSTRSKAPASKT